MKTKLGYTDRHAKAGVDAKMPRIETFPNQFRNDYEITITIPEYTAICPKTGLPDFGTLFLRYCPDGKVLELKSLKMYVLKYRNLGIFYENAVNKMLREIVASCRPRWCVLRGDFSSRGGISSTIEVAYNAALPRDKEP